MFESSGNDLPPAYSDIVRRHEAEEAASPSNAEWWSTEDLFDNDENKLKVERELLIRKQIEHNYPMAYILIDSVTMLTFNVVLIALQCVAIRYDAALSSIGSGIWAGLYNISVTILVLLTSK